MPFAHYVFPKGGHGLSVASYEQFNGWHGGEYVCEQLGMALEHIKNGTAVNMNEKRHEELMNQFFAPKKDDAPNPFFNNTDEETRAKKARETADYFADVHMWPELSRIWFERFL